MSLTSVPVIVTAGRFAGRARRTDHNLHAGEHLDLAAAVHVEGAVADRQDLDAGEVVHGLRRGQQLSPRAALPGWLDRLLRLDPPEGLRRWVPEPLRALDPLDVLRAVLVACQAILTLTAWDLWGDHRPVPHVPLVGALDLGGSIPWGVLILASLALVVVRPREGLVAHVAVLAAAMLTDQLRLQPQWISLALLLVATGPWRLSRVLGWAHLASLWLWAGVHKALSTGFGDGTAAVIADNLGVAGLRPVAAVGVPALEIALGVLAARLVTRELAIGPAVALHLGACVVLEMGLDWEILWWNLGLAAAAPVLLRDRVSTEVPGGRRTRATAGLASLLVAGLFLYPAGLFTAQVDPYLAHVLYADSLPRAEVCNPDGECSRWPIDVASTAIGGANIPPSPRTYRAWFERACAPGQVLRVSGLAIRAPFDRLPAGDGIEARCPTT